MREADPLNTAAVALRDSFTGFNSRETRANTSGWFSLGTTAMAPRGIAALPAAPNRTNAVASSRGEW